MVFLDICGQIVVFGLHIGEAVDAADDHSGILAQSVQDDTEGFLADLIGVESDLDRALGSRKGLVAREESEALGLLIEQHGAQVAVADTDLTLVSDGTGNTESLQAYADPFCCLCSGLRVLFHGDRRSELICPFDILEADGLCTLNDAVGIHALAVCKSLYILKALEAVLVKNGLQLRHTSFIVFKQSHVAAPPSYSLRGSIHLTAPSSAVKRPYVPMFFS